MAASPLELVVGTRNYSSWSLRPWLALRFAGVSFTTKDVDVAGRGADAALHSYSPSGLVPILLHKESDDEPLVVWDSLAILEYAADQLGAPIWPADARARAHARCISAEMHSGFTNVRGNMPMNIKYTGTGRPAAAVSEKEAAEVKRIAQIWSDCLRRYGGPYLFGAQPSGADAMYGPIVWRFYSYNVPLPDDAAAYMRAMLRLPAMREWRAAALLEEAAGRAIPHYDESSAQLGSGHRAGGSGLYDAALAEPEAA